MYKKTVEIKEGLEVEFWGTPKWEDQGIGVYEYWGFTERHVDWTLTFPNIEWDKKKYSQGENDLIELNLDEVEKSMTESYSENHTRFDDDPRDQDCNDD